MKKLVFILLMVTSLMLPITQLAASCGEEACGIGVVMDGPCICALYNNGFSCTQFDENGDWTIHVEVICDEEEGPGSPQ